MLSKSWSAMVALGLLLGVTGMPHAQTPAKLLVGFPTGGAPDVVARLFADHVRKQGGATIVVENRTGASGTLAIDAVLAAPADGNTLALIPSAVLSLLPVTVKNARFNPNTDFTPLVSLGEYGFAIATGASVPVGSLDEFIKWARSNPAKASYGTPGLGTPQHFLGATLARSAGIDLIHVPYRGGAQALTDVLGGGTASLITTEALIIPHHAKKDLRGLFVTSPQRNPRMGDVPTAKEAGHAQLEAVDWFGLFVRNGTPADAVGRVRQQATQVVNSREYIDAVTQLGYRVMPASPDQLVRKVEQDVSSWSARVKLSGFKVED